MAGNLDFAPIFTPNGTLSQIQYAQKSADNSATSIGMKSSKGIVLMRQKQKKSELEITELNKKIRKIKPTIFSTHSGLEVDMIGLESLVSKELDGHTNYYKDTVTKTKYVSVLSYYVSLFSRYWNYRPLALNIISGVYDEAEKSYNVFMTDTSGHTGSYHAISTGKGGISAKTELENLELADMSVLEMVREGIKIFYKIHDPLKDLDFEIEIVVLSEETGNMFKRLDKNDFEKFIEEFENMTFDME